MSRYDIPDTLPAILASEASIPAHRLADLSEPFLNLALYLQAEVTRHYDTRRESRANTFTMTVFCNKWGKPVAWLEPEHSKIIPYAGGLERILEMCEDQDVHENGKK